MLNFWARPRHSSTMMFPQHHVAVSIAVSACTLLVSPVSSFSVGSSFVPSAPRAMNLRRGQGLSGVTLPSNRLRSATLRNRSPKAHMDPSTVQQATDLLQVLSFFSDSISALASFEKASMNARNVKRVTTKAQTNIPPLICVPMTRYTIMLNFLPVMAFSHFLLTIHSKTGACSSRQCKTCTSTWTGAS